MDEWLNGNSSLSTELSFQNDTIALEQPSIMSLLTRYSSTGFCLCQQLLLSFLSAGLVKGKKRPSRKNTQFPYSGGLLSVGSVLQESTKTKTTRVQMAQSAVWRIVLVQKVKRNLRTVKATATKKRANTHTAGKTTRHSM